MFRGGTLKNGGSPPPRVPTRMEPALASEVAALVDRLRRALDANTAAAGGVPIDEKDKTTRRPAGLACQLSALLLNRPSPRPPPKAATLFS